ncbi:uncharacterized protein YdaU (DUF1376 family) [Bartonella silvatica]|uniref:Uncharacterized protein YdaU (DUF1376 family) n=1 Tax=Bartonella silvatica TaxID=357760 RepID=A0ABV2HHG8_9HYPH
MTQVNESKTSYYESSTLPYVCWYQNDFLGGVRGMRAHEIGIYTILLNEMYARGRPLELSSERLARLCGCDKRTFLNVLKMLIEEGKILKLDNGLWNKRCENIFHERAKLLEQKSFAGRSSAKKRKKINDQLQHLLNEKARNDQQSSEAQKREENETPNGVLEKKNCLMGTKEERGQTKTPASPKSPPSSAPLQQHTPTNAESHAHTVPHHAPTTTASMPTSARSKTKSRTTILKGQRLPADWKADIDAAIAEGLSEEQAHWQERKFRDYWHAKSGKEAFKVDWQATWRNWFRREIERLKEHQEKLAVLSSPPSSKPHCNDNDTLYRSLINYHT